MPGISVNKIPIPFKRAGINWSSYWATRNAYFALPATGVSLMVGQDVTIYGDTLINVPIGNPLVVEYTCDIGTVIGNNLTITPTVGDIGNHSLRMLFKNGGYTIEDQTIAITVYAKKNIGQRRILMVGDSTLDGDIQTIMPSLITALGQTVICVGTHGTGYLHEGRPGWTYENFATGATSPFVKDEAIDIASYFSDNGIDVPDIVYFRLGVNEMWSMSATSMDEAEMDTILGYASDLIDAFLAFDPVLQVIVALPTICSNTNAGWDANYDESKYSQDNYIAYMHRFWQKIIAAFDAGVYDARVGCSYEAINLDRDDGYPKTDGIHTNALHLATVGNQQMGIGLAQYINNNIPQCLTLEAQDSGTGVSTLRMSVSSDITVTLDGLARFYSNAEGTLDESLTWSLTAGALRTIYLKCPSGISKMKFSDIAKITEWGQSSSSSGWDSTSYSPNVICDISIFPVTLTRLIVTGENEITGDLTPYTSLSYIRVFGNNTLYGDVSNLTALTQLYVTGINKIMGDVGVNNVVNGITTLVLNPCAMTKYTGGATWSNALITINPSAGYGYSAAEIDAILIDMANSPLLVSKTITLQGSSAPRTFASDSAVATLEGAGRTCTLVLNT